MLKSKSYIEVEAGTLENSLQDLKSKIGDSEQSHTSFTTQNMILLTGSNRSRVETEELIDFLVRTNPARFFVVSFNEKPPEGGYRIEARCQIVSQEDRVCSEIIRIECGLGSIVAVASILRSHLLTGVATDIMLDTNAYLDDAVAKNIIALSERVIFDGLEIGGISKADWVGRYVGVRIDTQWLRLSPWREAVRMLFEIPKLGQRLSSIDRITIAGLNVKTGELSLGALYFAGWVLGCLGLEVVALGIDSYECRSVAGRAVDLKFIESKSGDDIDRLSIDFILPRAEDGTSETFSVDLFRSGDTIECIAIGDTELRTIYKVTEYSKLDLLRRFFLVGTSVNQYDSALRLAIDLENLKKGYHF